MAEVKNYLLTPRKSGCGTYLDFLDVFSRNVKNVRPEKFDSVFSYDEGVLPPQCCENRQNPELKGTKDDREKHGDADKRTQIPCWLPPHCLHGE